MESKPVKSSTRITEVPSYYSRIAIVIFTIIFSAIYGGVLLSMNITEKRTRWIVIVSSILYTLGSITFVRQVTSLDELVGLANLIGAILLAHPVWNICIDNETTFLPRPFGKLLLISIFVYTALILAIMLANPEN